MSETGGRENRILRAAPFKMDGTKWNEPFHCKQKKKEI